MAENKTGFERSGYIDKKGVTADESRLIQMPCGQDIEDQLGADIRPMTLKTIVPISYPGDGWNG